MGISLKFLLFFQQKNQLFLLKFLLNFLWISNGFLLLFPTRFLINPHRCFIEIFIWNFKWIFNGLHKYFIGIPTKIHWNFNIISIGFSLSWHWNFYWILIGFPMDFLWNFNEIVKKNSHSRFKAQDRKTEILYLQQTVTDHHILSDCQRLPQNAGDWQCIPQTTRD